jgi:hypothetical protein
VPVDPEPLVIDEADEATGPSNSPVTLTASDGSGLTISVFDARAVVEDPLAFTELHIVFHNPRDRVVEGQFSITLPSTATVSRFAMKQDWGWQEGEVVEKQAARRAYEDFLHRRQDPALLEKQPGNEFHARVFPIAPSADKEIILSYSEALSHAGEPYRVHLRGLPVLAKLDVRAVVGRRQQGDANGVQHFSYETVELHKQNVEPIANFSVPLPAISQQPQAGLRDHDLLVARITPVTQVMPDPLDANAGLTILFDTSASRALGFAGQVEKLSAIISALAVQAKDAPLEVVAFDQGTASVYDGTLGGFDEAARTRILERGALGASDLSRALAFAADQERTRPKHRRVLLVSDGIATAGDTDGAALKKAVLALAQAGVDRVDVLAEGGIRDAERLAALTTSGLARDGVVIDANKPVAAIARRLLRATVSHLKVNVPHAEWVWPTELNGVQPGDQVLVYAKLQGELPVTVNLDGAANDHFSYPIMVTEVERPLLERAVVNAEISRLEAARTSADKTQSAKLHDQIVELSTHFRVLCDETALLVLESEADYARFHIDRRALGDILTVGAGRIEVLSHRDTRPVVSNEQRAPDDVPAKDKVVVAKPVTPEEGIMGKISLPRGRAMNKGDRDGDGLDNLLNGEDGHADEKPAPKNEGPVAASTPTLVPPAAAPVAVASPQRSTGAEHERAYAAVLHMRDASGAGGEGQSVGLVAGAAVDDRLEPRNRAKQSPYEGKLKEVMALLNGKKLKAAEDKAQAWRNEDAGDVLALIALGEVWERMQSPERAARAYGSIIDLFPGRADLRRFAGERLERLGNFGLSLAIDTYKKAREERPDHPASHRLLAYALVRSGDLDGAFKVIREGAARSYPEDRFRGVDRILKEDVGLIGAALIAHAPKREHEITKVVEEAGSHIPTEPSLRFVLNWETDANDVDFHIVDGKGGHAYFSQKTLDSGGELYADVTTGYGPECFTIPGKPQAFPYTLYAHYYSRGPMGYGMGKLEIIEHDGHGHLKFEERAFVIMVDQAFVDLGRVAHAL